MINLSVVQFNLVNPSVQVPNWWWAESSRGLIGTEGICIGFGYIVLHLGYRSVNSIVVYKKFGLAPVFA